MVKQFITPLFFLLLVCTYFYSQLAIAGYVEECFGCHTTKRTQPIDGLFPNGFGHWRDSQCYGCHREINEIATNFNSSIFDKRLFALPVRKSRLKQLAHSPLSYMNAPQQLVFSINGIPRFDSNALLSFLQQPISLNKMRMPFTSMLAYPSLDKRYLTSITKKLNNNKKLPNSNFHSIKENIKQAKNIWHTQCKACHETKIAPYDKQGLNLFSTDWIYSYVNGFVNKTDNKREMPNFKLDKATAKGLKKLFSTAYQTSQTNINQSLVAIPEKPVNISGKTNKQAINYIWKRFFRDGMCVHCHGIEGRAKQHFDASNQVSISNWLKQNSPWKIWRRLEIRAQEVDAGIQATIPGMPMAAPALPKPMRQLFANWINESCPDLSGKNHCDGSK